MAAPGDKPFGSVPPPREDLTSGSLNLAAGQDARRPAILLNTQRPLSCRGLGPARPPHPTQQANHQPGSFPQQQSHHPMGAYPPQQPTHPMGSYPPQQSTHPMGSYPQQQTHQPAWASSGQTPPAWGPCPPSWPPAAPSWGAPAGAWGQTQGARVPGPWDYYYGQMYSGYGQPPPPAPVPPAPAKVLGLEPAPPPPGEEAGDLPKVKPEWQAAKKGALIYSTPRPPTPERPKPVEAMAPHGPVVVPVPANTGATAAPKSASYMDVLSNIEADMNKPVVPLPAYMNKVPTLPPTYLPPGWQPPAHPDKPKKKQFFYDGESWVFAFEQPAMKESLGSKVTADPVEQAILANVLDSMEKGKYTLTVGEGGGKMTAAEKRGRPPSKAVAVKCEVCGLTVSCMKTYESHIAGKPHMKKLHIKEKALALERRVKEDTERAKNSVPGGQGSDNPLESLDSGDIRCKVCDITMNSGAQAQGHLNGVKHQHRMGKHMRAQRGQGRGRGRGRGHRGGFNQKLDDRVDPEGYFANYTPRLGEEEEVEPLPEGGYVGYPGGGPGWGAQFAEPAVEKVNEDEVTTKEAEEEYRRVFNQCLENNFDLDQATKSAKAAMRAALGIVDSEDEDSGEGEEGEEVVGEEEDDDVETFPPPGISIVTPPSSDGGKPGCYRCEVCEADLRSEVELEEHLVTPGHEQAVSSSGLASLSSFPHGSKAARGSRGRGAPWDPTRGKVYRGRPNALSADTMKAQRGRRGLISYGEVMPSKLTKGQKKLAKKKGDISSILATHAVDAALTDPTQVKPKIPILQAFVKGHEGELHGSMKRTYGCSFGPNVPEYIDPSEYS